MKRALVTIAAVALATLPTLKAQAATPGYLHIRSATPAIAGFQASDTLFDNGGFSVAGLLGRGMRYASYGILSNGQVAVTTSENGTTWSTPTGARLTRPGGIQLPFTVGVGKRLAVTYVNAGRLPHGYRFAMLYTPSDTQDERATSNDPVFGSGVKRINNLRYALSADGVDWVEDAVDWRVSNNLFNATSGVITGPSTNTFKEGIVGPTDLIYNAGKSCYNVAVANDLGWGVGGSPFDCEFTLIYTSINQAGNTSIGIAGGVYFSDIGFEFRGAAGPALSRAQAAWASAGIDRGHVLQSGSTWTMGFSGSTSSARCDSNASACSVGTAGSVNGTSFTPHRASTPSISSAVASSIAGSAVSAHDLNPLADVAVEPHFVVGFGGATWNAYGADPLGTAPRLTFLKPQSGYVTVNDPNLSFVLNDDFGTNVGMDLGTLDVRIDGAPHTSPMVISETAVGQFTQPGKLFTINTASMNLSDGTHTLSVAAKDRDGESVAGSRSFLVDRTKPGSSIAEVSTSGFTFPFNSIFVEGAAQDTGTPTGLQRMRGTVTNPLGQTRTYEEGWRQTNNVDAGFNFTNPGSIVTNGGPVSWDYTWAVPMDEELFWAVPGEYTLKLQAFDFAGNMEGFSSSNSRTLLLL